MLRDDPFEDFFSYRSGTLGAGVEWEALENVEIEVNAGWRHVAYDVREAWQADAVVAPRLKYNYVVWEVVLSYDMFQPVSIEFFVDAKNRLSNVTEETSRIRRSYETIQGGMIITLNLRSR